MVKILSGESQNLMNCGKSGLGWQDSTLGSASQRDSWPLQYITLIMATQALRSGKKKQKPRKREEQLGEARQRSKKGIAQSKRRFGYWRRSQQLKYISFLEANYLIMKNAELRAEFQIFKKMAGCVRSRDAIQCKSHHQKMLMKNGNSLERILSEETGASSRRLDFVYQEEGSEKLVCEHLNKIETNEQVPYFMISQPHRLVIVIDQRFMISY